MNENRNKAGRTGLYFRVLAALEDFVKETHVLDFGSALLLARMRGLEGKRLDPVPITGGKKTPETRGPQGPSPIVYIFSGFRRRWLRRGDPGPEAA